MGEATSFRSALSCTNSPPAHNRSSEANTIVTIDGILHTSPPAPTSLVPDLPVELDRIILRTLEKDRELRYPNAGDLGSDLRRLKAQLSGESPRATTRPRLRSNSGLRHNGLPGRIASAAGIFFSLRHKQTPPLSAKDTIVLADFVNHTGDPLFDGTLRQGLAIQLEQSPFLSLVTDERIQSTLKLMNRPADAPLTLDVANEVCERTGAAAVLEGSIASLGTRYVLGLRAKNCHTGKIHRRRTGAGREKRGRLERAQSDCREIQNTIRRIARHRQRA